MEPRHHERARLRNESEGYLRYLTVPVTVQRWRLVPQSVQASSHLLVLNLPLRSARWSLTQALQSDLRSRMTALLSSSVLQPAVPVVAFEPKVVVTSPSSTVDAVDVVVDVGTSATTSSPSS